MESVLEDMRQKSGKDLLIAWVAGPIQDLGPEIGMFYHSAIYISDGENSMLTNAGGKTRPDGVTEAFEKWGSDADASLARYTRVVGVSTFNGSFDNASDRLLGTQNRWNASSMQYQSFGWNCHTYATQTWTQFGLGLVNLNYWRMPGIVYGNSPER
jgi:hypothetical protein